MNPSSNPSLLRLHHVQITIPRDAEDDARRFYCDLLGLVEVPKPESLRGRGGFWLALGDQQIHVGVEDGVDRTLTKAHVAYQVAGLDAWRLRLEEAGVRILDAVVIPGCNRFEFRDPFGNRVEFVEIV